MSIDATNPMNAVGLTAATTAACFWAVSVVLYRRVGRVLPPVRLNLVKGLIATALIGAFVLIDWRVLGHAQWEMSRGLLVTMIVSGMIGIGLGDTMFFAGLNRMGARRMLLLFTINPVITVLAAWALLGEPLSAWQVLGVALTCGGVAWVIAERANGNGGGRTDGHVDARGVCYGIGAATCQATGMLMSRYVFEQAEITALSSAWLRIVAGAVVLVLFLPLDRKLGDSGGRLHDHPKPPSKLGAVAMFTIAMMLGTVAGISLQQIAIKHASEVGVASTLLTTSPLFVLPITALLGERVSMRAVLGAAITIAGVALLFGVSG